MTENDTLQQSKSRALIFNINAPFYVPIKNSVIAKTKASDQIPTARLFDAAIAVDILLLDPNIRHDIFGGCALRALRHTRKSKDVD